ncbi:MAG: tyrosine-protein phosphatase [Candidatus Omnitrophica bacterium]|nr:tyrosine-protein phosphatase [Candidatus Omnitrophota bacterium]
MKKILMFFYLGVVFITGCAYLGYLKDPFENIPNFYKVSENLYRGGQPKEAGFRFLKQLGIKTVVSLRGKNYHVELERKIIENMGMNFFSIPLSVYQQPEEKQVLEFLEILLKREYQPVFVHCDSGRDRTGAMIAMYRVVVDGWTIKQAYREARKFGFFPYRSREAPLKMFIHQLKDKKIYFEKARQLKNE